VATIFTIGHSTRTLDQFISILEAHGIEALADVRSYPASRRLPWFQGPQHPPFMTEEEAKRNEALETTLPRAGIHYVWLKALGGRRKRITTESPHTALRSDAFRNYADYMLTDEFRTGVAELLRVAEAKRTAIMCAEAQVYYHCHRMLLSDYLAVNGHAVLHVSSALRADQHRITPEARVVEGRLIYRGDMLF